MLSPEHLALRSVRLKPSEEWVAERNSMLFVFPQAGSGLYLSRLVTHRFSAGDVLVLHPTTDGKVCGAEGGEMAFRFFSVSLEHLFPLFASREISLLRNVCEGFKTTRRHEAGTALARECHRLLAEAPPPPSLEHRAQLLRVAATVLDEEFRTTQPQRSGFFRAEDHLIQVFEQLPVDDFMSLPVGELAAKFSCSKRHLNRLFHRCFGYSVAAIRMEMRLSKAVALLRDPEVKIISVAEQCGFNYLGLFNACFKRRFGVTPGQQRRLLVWEEGRLGRPRRSNGSLRAANRANAPPCQASARASAPASGARLVITVKPLNAAGSHDRFAVQCDVKGLPNARTTLPTPA